jgi:hypothetical protein
LERFTLIEHDLTVCLWRFATSSIAKYLGDCARLTSAKIVIFTDDEPMKSARCDFARMLDQTVVAIAGNANDAGHAPMLPFTRHAADRFKCIRIVTVVNHHVAAV